MNNLTLQNRSYSANKQKNTLANNQSNNLVLGLIKNTPDVNKRDLFSAYYKRLNTFTSTENFVKGKLVKGSLFKNPFSELKSGIKTFAKALKGEGNDYSIGKLNDPAIALGTLSIATMLAAAAKSPFNKSMEFVGASTWLASMTLWPNLFLAKPVKAMTGVDMNLQYVSSQGNKKP